MAFAVAKQDVAALVLESNATAWVQILPSREVLFARWTFVGSLTCVYRVVSPNCATEAQPRAYAISRASSHVPGWTSVTVRCHFSLLNSCRTSLVNVRSHMLHCLSAMAWIYREQSPTRWLQSAGIGVVSRRCRVWSSELGGRRVEPGVFCSHVPSQAIGSGGWRATMTRTRPL